MTDGADRPPSHERADPSTDRPSAPTSGRLRRTLPEGRGLADDRWLPRHRVMTAVLWLHVVGLPVYGVYRGYGVLHCLVDTAPMAVMWLAAAQPRGGRTFRSVMSALGLMTAAALLVHLSGGVIEAHFHFFVMVALLSLYQDWVPFLLALAFVVVQHGVMGALFPATVYDHLDAYEHPWRWAFIHGGFALTDRRLSRLSGPSSTGQSAAASASGR